MDIDDVITTRVAPGGGWVVYRVDIAVDLPEDAVEPSLAPARAVAERLGLEIVGGSADVEVDDSGVPFTGRAVVLRSEL
jgi:selenophosphate synthetase-related protein